MINKMLEPFTQFDMRLSRNYDGAGMGLSIAKSLAEIMDGTLEIDSEVDKGTNVTVTLPEQSRPKDNKND